MEMVGLQTRPVAIAYLKNFFLGGKGMNATRMDWSTMSWSIAVCLGLGISGLLQSDIAASAEEQTATLATESTLVTVLAGTTINVMLFENVNSSFNTMGETVQLTSTEDIVVNGRIAIAKGARIKA